MNTAPDNEFDLEKLFLPAWAQQEPASAKYAKYEGTEESGGRRDDRRGRRPERREGGPSRFPGGGQGGRPPGPGARPGPGGRNERSNRGGPDRGPRPGGGGRRDSRDQDRRPQQPPPAPLPEVTLDLIPDAKGVESLARQIKMTGRAYPLFDIAQMILQKPERHSVVFRVKKDAEGKILQPLYMCALDDSLWLSEEGAVSHVLRKHFATFYQAERTATEPPKGTYTFVAQCGLSGNVLGPPNHHDYQNQIHKLHTERFSRMPFEVYKSRVRIVRDEAVVKKWIDDQSWKTDYICLNQPEPLRLPTMEAVEKHFRETHKDNIIKPVETHTLSGAAARALRSPELLRALRMAWEDQKRFPLQIATVLSQQFASHGLQFFKVNKTITHVSVARPHFLDMDATPVSEGVKRIVDFINSHPKSSRRKLVEALAPSPVESTTITLPPEGAPAAAAASSQPTSEQTAVVSDLHWLIHQGHVIEFANGILETAKKPFPKPPKPERKKEVTPEPGSASPDIAAKPEEPGDTTPTSADLRTEAEAATENVPPESKETEASAAPENHPEPASAPAEAQPKSQ